MLRIKPKAFKFLNRNLVQALLISLLALAAILLPGQTAQAAAQKPAIVYHDPSCHCCSRWIEHLTLAGFQPESVETVDLENLKQQYNIPAPLTSCHTAIINGYVIEGHVPIADIQRLLAEQPNLAGITVPGMPTGTPGMESGDQRESFTVFSFDHQGNQTVFNQYSF